MSLDSYQVAEPAAEMIDSPKHAKKMNDPMVPLNASVKAPGRPARAVATNPVSPIAKRQVPQAPAISAAKVLNNPPSMHQANNSLMDVDMSDEEFAA